MTTPSNDRRSSGRIVRDDLLHDVRDGLSRSPKELNPKYFYDERGSDLFERITRLPEYYLTGAERRLLRSNASELIKAICPNTLLELGAGSANKTRILLDAMRETGCGQLYIPVDVSEEFIESVAAQLRQEYPAFDVKPAVADISKDFVLPGRIDPTLLAFLGSTIGNFGREEAIVLLSRCTLTMHDGDRFLLGVDLRKDVHKLEAAYNDSAGVTADFNLNVLRVINAALDANFDLSKFRHRAFYNSQKHRIEMHLEAIAAHAVEIPGVGTVEFRKGESVRTELSYKYDRDTITDLFNAAGLTLASWISDSENLFALALGAAR